jgi:predicted nucleic acid-binding protein
VTVLDTSAVIDFLLDDGEAARVRELLARERTVAAPDILVFEVLAVLRRDVLRGELDPTRADGAIEDLGAFPVELYPSMMLRRRAWDLRDNLTAADGLFVALAEQLDEPLVTKDSALATAGRDHADITTVHLGPS